eukprot:5225698-Prymnesium_polylepis.2
MSRAVAAAALCSAAVLGATGRCRTANGPSAAAAVRASLARAMSRWRRSISRRSAGARAPKRVPIS